MQCLGMLNKCRELFVAVRLRLNKHQWHCKFRVVQVLGQARSVGQPLLGKGVLVSLHEHQVREGLPLVPCDNKRHWLASLGVVSWVQHSVYVKISLWWVMCIDTSGRPFLYVYIIRHTTFSDGQIDQL